MTRYFFDMREDDILTPDEEGLEFANFELAKREAALSIAGWAREAVETSAKADQLVVEVRTTDGPIFKARFTYETIE